MKRYGLILIATALVFSAQADWKESLNQAWQNTGELTDKTIRKSKQFSDKAIQGSKDFYDSLSDNVRPLTKTERQVISKQSVINETTEHLKKVWPDVLENLDDALRINSKIDVAPASRWFGDDKASLRKDQIEVFAEIETLLSSPAISANRKHIAQLKNKIVEQRRKMAKLKEKKVFAAADEKRKLDHTIKKSLHRITVYSDNIEHEKENLKIRMQQMGLMLNNDQIDVLLSRVDSDDIIKMSVIYDVLADITRQLLELTQEFNEDINQARKYYGMHVVLLKFILNMQQSYITKLNDKYLPKIDNIRKETVRLSQESRNLIGSEKQPEQRKLLQKNLQAQQLTLKVANLYAQQLVKQRTKIEEARERVKRDYRVAKNTYDTVKLSAELIRLMKSNQASFNALMNIQVPEIVPFKNREMQKKFEELSILLKSQ